MKFLVILTLIVLVSSQNQNCITSLQGNLLHLKTWENKDLRDQNLSALLQQFTQVEGECKACEQDVLSLQPQVYQLVQDVEHKQWMDLIDEVIALYKSADSFYQSCISPANVFIQDSCVSQVEQIKNGISQVIVLKNWENTTLRKQLLNNVVSILFNIDQSCKGCVPELSQIKSDVEAIITDYKTKQYSQLLSEAFTTLDNIDQVYQCVNGQTIFQQQGSCVATVEGVKSTLQQIFNINTWTNSAKRSAFLNNIVSVAFDIDTVCQPCLSFANTIKTDIQTIVTDSKAQNKDWLAIVQQVLGTLNSVSQLYNCATKVSQQTVFVATSPCETTLIGLKGTLKNLTQLRTWTDSTLRGNEINALLSGYQQVSQVCQGCKSDGLQLKNEIESIVADVSTQNYFALIGQVVGTIKTAENFKQTCLN